MTKLNMTEEELQSINLDMLAQSQKKFERRNRWIALLFMSPALFLVGTLLLYPVAFNIWISFTKWKKFKGFGDWAGIKQYTKLFSNPQFEVALGNSFLWVVVSFVVPVFLGLFFALLVKGQRFEETAKSIFFLPRVLAPTAVGAIWFYLYAPEGVFNSILEFILNQPVDIGWLYDKSTVSGSIIVAYLWQTVGLAMVLLLLGLAALPKDPIEAASVEGANYWQILKNIQLPLLLPTILVVVILSVIAGFTVFDHIYVMARDFPMKRVLSLTVYMYVEGFEKSSWAYASAIAVILGVIVVSVTWLQIILQDKIERLTK